jgi:sugar/nucleoside kinase (ribokinase family)
VVLSASDRSFISSLGANDDFSVEYLMQPRVLDAVARCDHVHLSNFLGLPSLHRPAADGSDIVTFVAALRQRNPRLTVSLDPQHANNGLWLGEGFILTRLLPMVDLFLPNDAEAEAVAALLPPRTLPIHAPRAQGAAQPPAAVLAGAAVAERVRQGGMVVVTQGPAGASALVRQAGSTALLHQDTFPVKVRAICAPISLICDLLLTPLFPPQVVDTTGGGDAFEAAFLLGWLSSVRAGASRDDAVRAGLAAGCAAGALRVGTVSGSEQCPAWYVHR